MRENHSEWESEVSDSEMCTDFGLAVDIIDDEEINYEEDIEQENKKERKGWTGVKDIIKAQ